jgi:hypothetical protein
VARSRTRIVLALIFAFLALNAWAQVALRVIGRSDDPLMLSVLQSLIGVAGTAAAWATWTSARWAPIAALAHGASTAGMLIALGPMLDLEPDARGGILIGAAAVFIFGLVSAWYLRRASRPRADSLRA